MLTMAQSVTPDVHTLIAHRLHLLYRTQQLAHHLVVSLSGGLHEDIHSLPLRRTIIHLVTVATEKKTTFPMLDMIDTIHLHSATIGIEMLTGRSIVMNHGDRESRDQKSRRASGRGRARGSLMSMPSQLSKQRVPSTSASKLGTSSRRECHDHSGRVNLFHCAIFGAWALEGSGFQSITQQRYILPSGDLVSSVTGFMQRCSQRLSSRFLRQVLRCSSLSRTFMCPRSLNIQVL